MGPHPLPGHALDGETAPVDIEEDPSVLLLLLAGRPGAVVWRRGAGLLLGAAAEEAVRAGALGAAVSAQLGRRRAGPAGRVGSRHRRPGGRLEVSGRESSSGSQSLLWFVAAGELMLISEGEPGRAEETLNHIRGHFPSRRWTENAIKKPSETYFHNSTIGLTAVLLK